MDITLPHRTSNVTVDPARARAHERTQLSFESALRDRFGPRWAALRFSDRAIGGLDIGATTTTAEPGDLTDPPYPTGNAEPAEPDDAKRETVDSPPYWTLHLPIAAIDAEAALTIAAAVIQMAARHPLVVARAATIAPWHDNRAQVPVLCNNRVEGSEQLCGQRNHHRTPCDPAAA